MNPKQALRTRLSLATALLLAAAITLAVAFLIPRSDNPPVLSFAPPAGIPELPPGADADWWRQVAADLADREYRASPVDGTLQAPNRAHGLRSWFRTDGLELTPRDSDAAAWRWRWRTTAWGRPDAMSPAPDVAPILDVARVAYVREGLVEWYANGPDGLEQGFTVNEPPAGEGRLHIVGTVTGDLTAGRHSADAIDFDDSRGNLVLRYGKLRVWDARQRELPAEMVLAEAAIELRIDDRGAVYPLTIDPIMTAPSWTGECDWHDSLYGHALGTAGDVNGDGYSDVIVGAPFYDGGHYYEGRVMVYLGSASGLASEHHWYREVNQQNAFFGWSVGTAGDVDGDGYDDVIVGGCNYDGDAYDSGIVQVHHGSADGLDWNAEWEMVGADYNDQLGTSVATAGDVNGDGYDDIIVGAPYHEHGFIQDGKVMVFHGSAGGLATTPAWTVYGERQWDRLGNCVSWAGDVNGDGYDDVIIGSSPESWTTDDPGYASVYLGSASGLAASRVWSVYDDAIDSWFAYSVAGAGDVDGDGYADVIVGAPYYDNGTGTGRVLVFHGNEAGVDAAPALTLDCDQLGALYGMAVASAGDVNGDGYADIIIGAEDYDHGQTDEGFAWIHLGYYNGVQPEAAWYKDSDQAGATYGCAVATAGDVNGDGFSDVLVGAELYDHGEDDEGLAWCYLGGSEGPRDQAGWVIESNQAGAESGYSVACLGDVNGDGYDDAAVSAPFFDNGQPDEGAVFVFLGTHLGLAWLPSWFAESDQSDSDFGTAVAAAGDVNGDGLCDIIVGARDYTGTLTEEGAVFVWESALGGLPYGNPDNATWSYFSGQSYCSFGQSVACAGDVNGDGYADVAVGAPYYDHGTNNEGAVFCFHGSASGLPATHDWFHDTGSASSGYGMSVASAGDMNGDGYSDLIVGAPHYDHPDTDEGLAFVYIGSSTGLQTGAPWWYAQSNQEDANLGYCVASAGDVDGDGYSDVIIGAPTTDTPAEYGGAAYVWYGAASPPPVGHPGNANWTSQRNQDYAWYGNRVDGAGDVNGDGYSDVVVSMPYDNNDVGIDAGAVALYLGSPTGLHLGAADWIAQGAQVSGWFGRGLSGRGDYNGDGFSDVLVGAPKHDAGQENEGRSFVFYGNQSRGLARTPRQWQPDLSTNLAPLGRSTSETGFGLSARGRTALGRGRVRLECEVKPFGVPFDGNGTVFGTWEDTGPPAELPGSVVHLTRSIGGLASATTYHWRLRVHGESPFFPGTPWLTLGWNGATETDLRTAGTVSAVSGETPDLATGLRGLPNPFNPRTTFHFALAGREHVVLTVYDARGRQVRELVDGFLPAGSQAVLWDGRDDGGREVASGVYLARIRATSLTARTKVTLIR